MKLWTILLVFVMLCSCQTDADPQLNYDSMPDIVQNLWLDREGEDSGLLFAEDLDQSGSPELYLLYSEGSGRQNILWGVDVRGADLGSISMNQPADEEWKIVRTFNERKVYLSAETTSTACVADDAPPHTQHNITLENGALESFDVLISNVFGAGTSYVINGKTITDQKQYREAMADYFLQDGRTEIITLIPYNDFAENPEEFAETVTEALMNWEAEKHKKELK